MGEIQIQTVLVSGSHKMCVAMEVYSALETQKRRLKRLVSVCTINVRGQVRKKSLVKTDFLKINRRKKENLCKGKKKDRPCGVQELLSRKSTVQSTLGQNL